MTQLVESISDTGARILAYWHELKGEIDLPSKEQFDPLAVWYALGNISLIDVLPDDSMFFRLIGSNAILNGRHNLAGKSVDHWPEPEMLAMAKAAYRKAIASQQPLFGVHDAVLDRRRWVFEFVLLPFGHNGRVDRLVQYFRKLSSTTTVQKIL